MTNNSSKVLRDTLYWVIYNNTKTKHPTWRVSQLHAVTSQLRAKATADMAVVKA